MVDIATTWDRVKNTPGLLRDLIAITTCIAVGLVCSGYILVHQSPNLPWADKYTFSATFDKAPGVSPSALQEVRIAGVPVGRITGAKADSGGQAKLTMSIDPDQTVYRDARIVLTTKAPLNVMYMTLDPGSASAGKLPENATLPITQTRRATQPYEVLDNLDAKTRAGLTSLLNESDVVFAKAGQDLPASLDATGDAMVSFRPVLDQLAQRREYLSRLVHSMSVISRTVGEDDKRLSVLTDSAHQTLRTLADRDDKLVSALDELPGFTEDLDGAMDTVSDLTADLDPTLDDLGRASSKLPDAVESLTGSVKAIHHFVDRASPVVDRAGPVVADLRPFSVDARTATAQLDRAGDNIPKAVSEIVSWQPPDRAAGRLPWLDDLGAFVYNTSSSFSLMDANGGMGRAALYVDLTNPTGGLGDVGETPKGQGPGTAAGDDDPGKVTSDDASDEPAAGLLDLFGDLLGSKESAR
ncbi:MlaD family protein [Aeromicrobium ginsengisoli]|uniref:MCE family protein n=1 Tax=Aeromicrobium ginsengisoli TaxID=363867 RepID=A0A5M4F8Y0_9ACTN|nr:MlaD family protein [Aeromicrobium ginsengisoli]KAA1394242.1 MCE family protein [Aeromicrobium ginsengisoli]